MRLPITVSIINALIVQCGPFELAFPLSVVKKTLEVKPSKIQEEDGHSMVILEDSRLQLLSLRHALRLPETTAAEGALLPIVVCDIGNTLLAFSVDHISGQQEIFVRPLRSPLSYLRGVSGATVTGDGRVLFVVDASALT